MYVINCHLFYIRNEFDVCHFANRYACFASQLFVAYQEMGWMLFKRDKPVNCTLYTPPGDGSTVLMQCYHKSRGCDA